MTRPIVVAAALALALAAPAAAQRGDHRSPAERATRRPASGQLELTLVIYDRGVGHVTTLDYRLATELTVAPGGRVAVHVRGTLDRQAAFLVPPGGPQPAESMRLEVDETHAGTVVSEDASGFLVRLDPDARGVSHGWRCDRIRERVGDRERALVRCAAATPHTGLPWSDPLPAYLRAPMIVAEDGGVRARVSASADRDPIVQLLPAR